MTVALLKFAYWNRNLKNTTAIETLSSLIVGFPIGQKTDLFLTN